MSNNCDSSYLSLINELNDKVENVKKQKDDLNERLRKSEQEKEHWKVEYQLVQMKHDKLKNHMNGKLYKTNVHFIFHFILQNDCQSRANCLFSIFRREPRNT